MKLTVNTSVSYDILIEAGASAQLPDLLCGITQVNCAVIVSDDNVFTLYGQQTVQTLESAGFKVFSYIIGAGEEQKNLTTLSNLLAFLTENAINKGDILIALGGGVVSDLTGFAASCYLRGIKYATVTTTLLAAVDASVGGKTAVDHAGQKNNVGAFYPPHLVVCDTEQLKTLPKQELQNGLVEAIKSGLLHDHTLFEELCRPLDSDKLEQIIYKSLCVKRYFVEQDEKDNGARQLLNLGHTLGHAIEAESGYKVAHGAAVAAGLVAIVKAAEKRELTVPGLTADIIKSFEVHGIEYQLPYSFNQLVPHISKDKKTRGKQITLALIKDVADPFLYKIDVAEVGDFFLCE